MFLSEFSTKHICLRTLLWSGLVFSSLCSDEPPGPTTSELGVVGPPPASTTTLTSTITVTKTLGYVPSLIPGNSQYGLVGCYSPPSSDGGYIFGANDHNASSSPTVDDCLKSCGSAAPPSKGTELYMYAGLRNGSECLCGLQLSKDAHKLSANDCAVPCSGDPRLSCGGKINIAVYSLIPGVTVHTQTSPSGPSSSTELPTTIRPPDSSFTINPSSKSTEPKKLGTAPTVGAVVGSLSGAIILAAGLFICYRAHKRKKQDQDAHVKSMLDRRGPQSVPNPISTSANVHGDIANVATPRHKRNTSTDGGAGNGTDHPFPADRDFIPTTPGLEAGGTSPGLRTRRASSAVSAGAEQRDNPHGTPMGGVRSGPVNPRTNSPAAGASSAVQWRPNNTNGSGALLSPSAAHEATMSLSSSVATPPPSAYTPGLGERAWHRRKLSTPYQPPASAGLGAGVGAGAGIAAAGAATLSNRGNMARRGPPSRPPEAPLPPPPPPPKPGVRAISQPRSRAIPSSLGNARAVGGNRPPPRPKRRSFDMIVLEPEVRVNNEPSLTPTATNRGAALGMSHANMNMSTPSLGRHGSRRSKRKSNLESPVLGWQPSDLHRQRQWSPSPREKRRKEPLADREPTIPVLPPVAPGERFDHKRWRGTIYDQLPETSEGVSQQQGRRGRESRNDARSPVSVSSVGTSILFTPEEFDRQR
ncbi:hypothetical protein F5Y10DRAFT_283008 [Nemania abortiva]|nr:hypothetical protein F5Y10DRAFT_283008 [Nemania abortiva]